MSRIWQKAATALLLLSALVQCKAPEAPPADPLSKPRVHLMTSLPLVWGEDASMETILSGEAKAAPIYRHWQDQYDIAALDSLEKLVQEDPDIVFLVQPRAMDPADLAALDSWLREGGDVIILTDPELVWPSELPLGDPRRPLASGLLSPLLDHWGLELVEVSERRARATKLRFGTHVVTTYGVGKLQPAAANGNSGATCKTSGDGAIAQCLIGQGRASIVADADFLNAASWAQSARRSPRDSGAGRFIDSLVRDHLDSPVRRN